jgi:hypothetical protein
MNEAVQRNDYAEVIRTVFCFLLTALCLCSYSLCRAQFIEEGSDQDSFFHEVLSGKYNLIEEDFADVPHKTSRYDFLKEKMESLRPFSRHDGDEYAIVCLQWKDGRIFVNDFQTVPGSVKKRRVLFSRGEQPFCFRLFSSAQTPVYEEEFDIPSRLHYDYFDEETGKMGGGAVEREQADFVLKIPLSNKSADRIKFYKRPLYPRSLNRQTASGSGGQAEENVLGEAVF